MAIQSRDDTADEGPSGSCDVVVEKFVDSEAESSVELETAESVNSGTWVVVPPRDWTSIDSGT
jgi:hypothetical protein